jgi:hypothetical protein
MLEVTGHGKDEADGHGGVFKNWILGEMQRADFVSTVDAVMEVRIRARARARVRAT